MMHEKRRRAVLDAKMSELSQTEGKLKAALFEVISVFACGYGSTRHQPSLQQEVWSERRERSG